MGMIRLSDPLEARIKELQSTRQAVFGRKVTMSEVVEILFANYDATVEAENAEGNAE